MISIIIAAYNSERFVRKGIDGILNQTYQDFEVLVIDDGSSDRTANLCDEYAATDSRIRVFREPHSGVSHTRQVGINHARGNYIIHVDLDDEVDPTMLHEMHDHIEKEQADMLICDYTLINKTGEHYNRQEPSALNNTAVLGDLLSGRLYGSLWNKLIKTSLYRKVSFQEDLTMREDMVVLCSMLPHTEKIAYLPKSFYHYDKTSNPASLTNKYLDESKAYYVQEIKWHAYVLDNPLLSTPQKNELTRYLLRLAYICLNRDMMGKKEWMTYFGNYRNNFASLDRTYIKSLIMLALNDHYDSASFIRTIIAKMR